MPDKALSVTLSLYNSQVKKIKKTVKKSNRFNSESALVQYIIDAHFGKQVTFKDIMAYIGYPLIFVGVMLYVASSTQHINEKLLRAGLLTDLLFQNQIFYIIGFMFLGITIAGAYLYVAKTRGAIK